MKEQGKNRAGRKPARSPDAPPSPFASSTSWKPGQSGNPAGRPRGARNKIAGEYLELLDLAAPEIFAKVVEMAKQGSPCALRLVVERLLPAKLERVSAFEVPVVQAAVDIAGAIAEVIRAVGAGEITMEEGHAFARLIEGQRRALETSELAVQLRVIEAKLSERALPDDEGSIQ